MSILNIISKSKIRQRALLLFIYNPEKSYYINETARLIDTSAGNAQRELENLRESGLLKKKEKGNSVYFSLNKSCSILPEVKSIVDKTVGLKHILKDKFSNLTSVTFAFLFGSYVKGDFGPNSDIDLYIIGDIKESEVYDRMREIESRINREVNYHISSEKEFKEKLEKSFFHKEILSNYSLIIGDKNEFERFIG